MRKLSALVITLILSLCPLAASTLRIGLCSFSDDMSYATTSAIHLIGSRLAESERMLSINERRDRNEARRAYDTTVHTALDKDTAPGAEPEFFYLPPSGSNPVYELVEPEVTDDIRSFVLSGDESALDYLLLRDRLDVLFIMKDAEEPQLREYTFQMYDGSAFIDVDSALIVKGQEDDYVDELATALIEVIGISYGLVSLEDFPAFVSVSEGEAVLLPIADRLLLSSGLHELVFSASGFATRTLSLEVVAGEELVPDGEMQPLPPLTFLIDSIPYGATVSLGGDEQFPLPAVGEMMMPVILTGRAEGFQPLQLQMQNVPDVLTLELKPEWMAGEGRVTDAKKDMYSALRLALLSLGSSAVVMALNTVYPEVMSTYQVPLNTLTIGVSVLAILDFLHDAAVYYNTAREVYL